MGTNLIRNPSKTPSPSSSKLGEIYIRPSEYGSVVGGTGPTTGATVTVVTPKPLPKPSGGGGGGTSSIVSAVVGGSGGGTSLVTSGLDIIPKGNIQEELKKKPSRDVLGLGNVPIGVSVISAYIPPSKPKFGSKEWIEERIRISDVAQIKRNLITQKVRRVISGFIIPSPDFSNTFNYNYRPPMTGFDITGNLPYQQSGTRIVNAATPEFLEKKKYYEIAGERQLAYSFAVEDIKLNFQAEQQAKIIANELSSSAQAEIDSTYNLLQDKVNNGKISVNSANKQLDNIVNSANKKMQDEFTKRHENVMKSYIENSMDITSKKADEISRKVLKQVDKRNFLPNLGSGLITGAGIAALTVIAPPVGLIYGEIQRAQLATSLPETKAYIKAQPYSFAGGVVGGIIGGIAGGFGTGYAVKGFKLKQFTKAVEESKTGIIGSEIVRGKNFQQVILGKTNILGKDYYALAASRGKIKGGKAISSGIGYTIYEVEPKGINSKYNIFKSTEKDLGISTYKTKSISTRTGFGYKTTDFGLVKQKIGKSFIEKGAIKNLYDVTFGKGKLGQDIAKVKIYPKAKYKPTTEIGIIAKTRGKITQFLGGKTTPKYGVKNFEDGSWIYSPKSKVVKPKIFGFIKRYSPKEENIVIIDYGRLKANAPKTIKPKVLQVSKATPTFKWNWEFPKNFNLPKGYGGYNKRLSSSASQQFAKTIKPKVLRVSKAAQINVGNVISLLSSSASQQFAKTITPKVSFKNVGIGAITGIKKNLIESDYPTYVGGTQVPERISNFGMIGNIVNDFSTESYPTKRTGQIGITKYKSEYRINDLIYQKIKVEEKKLINSRQSYIPKENIISNFLLGGSSISTPAISPRSVQQQRVQQKQNQIQIQKPNFIIPTPTFKWNWEFPKNFNLPKGYGGYNKRTWSGKTKPSKRAYTSSVAAYQLGIKMLKKYKTKQKFTGLEIRPLENAKSQGYSKKYFKKINKILTGGFNGKKSSSKNRHKKKQR